MIWRLPLCLLTLAIASLPAPSVSAQGFFRQYSLPLPAPRPYRGDEGANPYMSFGRGSGTYRTLCVRLCDGYYFPISFSATRDALARDAAKCATSCGSEARLFYHSNPGGEVDSMIDLSGMAYTQLPTAFKYRKTLVSGCACRPQPWTEAELQRHQNYADGQLASTSITGDGASRSAQVDDTRPDSELTTASGELLPIARPAPVSRYALPQTTDTAWQRNLPVSGRTSRGGMFH
jgi:Protein of unknown function (DUF2865)